jgi:hypothetical protein
MLHLSDNVLVITVKPYLLVLKLLFALLSRVVFCWQYLSRYPTVLFVICALRVRGRDVRKKK